MASNPLNMKPTELIRLMNRAGFGTVLNESRLKTHRLNDINTADNKGVDLLKYTAWLTLEYFSGVDESSEYLERKCKQAERNAEAVRVAQDIGKLPDVADQRRKDEALDSFRRFCETYFGEVFYLPWSDDHLHVISKIERAVTQGGLFAMAMPRGSGKTVLCQTAVVWAALSGATPFVCLIAASAERGKDLLENIKTWLETNELLQQDFPEVCFPIQCLERIANRQKGQKHNGQPTRIEWGADRIILPTIKGSAASGVVISCNGMRGSEIRGQNYARPDGKVVRPRLVLIDDPQTTESAWSLLYWIVVAWDRHFSGNVIDYGTWPDQKRPYFLMRDAHRTLQQKHPSGGLEGTIYAGLEALCDERFATPYHREDGNRGRIVTINEPVRLPVSYPISRPPFLTWKPGESGFYEWTVTRLTTCRNHKLPWCL